MELDSGKQNGIPKLIQILLICDIILVLLYLGNHFVDYPFSWFTEFIDLDNENNLPAWYSSIQIFLLAITSGMYLRNLSGKEQKLNKLAWIVPLIFVVMSLDEIAMIHEEFGEMTDFLLAGGTRRNTVFRVTGIWMFIVGIPFFALMLGIILHLKSRIGNIPGGINKFILGLVVYVVSAVGIEILSNYFRRGAGYLTQVILEEFGEMLGVTIVLWGIIELLNTQGMNFGRLFPRTTKSERL